MGKLACKDNCLQTLNPELVKQWHPTKNGALTPMNVTQFSGRKVWWICDKKHEWRADIHHRAHGTGCPYCSGNAVCQDNCLQTKNPKLSKQWHSKKNGRLTPKDITPGSNKKVWWICENEHEWQAIVNNRVKGTKCPICSKRRATELYIRDAMKAQLSAERLSAKNGYLTPEDILPFW